MPQAALLWSPGGADNEARLARAAAGGNGRAFATLLERYEQRVFNLALRITGSHDAAVRATREAFVDALRALPHLEVGESFGSCLLTAARNATHEPGAADGGEPAGPAPAGRGEGDADPDFEAWQEQLRVASLRLPPHEREALALAGLEEPVSYDDLAAIMDTDAEAVPELVARSRIGLHDELFDTSLGSMPAASEDCEQALPLIAMRDDGRLDDEDDFAWLVDHLAHCGECRLRLDAVEEASDAYRGWRPVTPPPTLFRETMTAAARLAGADWGELVDEREARRAAGRPRRRTVEAIAVPNPLPALAPALSGAGDAATEALGSLRASASGLASGAWQRRPDRDRLVTAGLLAVVLLGLSAIAAGAALMLKDEDKPSAAVSPAVETDSAPTQTGPTFPATGPEPRPRGVAGARKRKARPKKPAVTTAPEIERPTPDEDEAERPRLRRVPQAVAVPVPQATPKPPASDPPTTAPPAETTPAPQLQPGCKDPSGTAVPCP